MSPHVSRLCRCRVALLLRCSVILAELFYMIVSVIYGPRQTPYFAIMLYIISLARQICAYSSDSRCNYRPVGMTLLNAEVEGGYNTIGLIQGPSCHVMRQAHAYAIMFESF